MANHRLNEDSYCTRALTSEYNAESGGGTTTGVARQRHRLGPSIITPTSRSSNRGSCFLCCGQFFNVLLRFRGDSEELEQRYKSREIDKFLKKDKPTLRKQVKLLLLGAGESGKSTFLKQMRIIHGVHFEPELVREYQQVIYQNIIKGMQVLVDAREKLKIPWEDQTTEEEKNIAEVKMLQSNKLDSEQFALYAPLVKRLWKYPAIKQAFDRRREYQLSDSVSYFLDEIDRISKPEFIPETKDILHCRKATKGVIEFSIYIENIPFLFVDVGGQRTQRQKWTKCFDQAVNSIIFLVSTSEFDQVLAEDRKTNRLEESKNIFDTIVNNKTFEGISIILFLNKIDLLAIKVRDTTTNIKWYYPEFTGNPHSILDVQNFILKMFHDVRKNTKTVIYHHFTSAVDTTNIENVFKSVKDSILHRNLSALMLQ